MYKTFISTIQEMTIEAYANGLYDLIQYKKKLTRKEILDTFVDWADEFEKEHLGVELGDTIYDALGAFLDKKYHELVDPEPESKPEEIPFKPSFKYGDYIEFEGVDYMILGITDRGYRVREVGYKTEEEMETTEIGFVNEQDSNIIAFPTFEEIMNTGNGHSGDLVKKINYAWNHNQISFKPILCALYERDIEEITDHDAFQIPDWRESKEYNNGVRSGDWYDYNEMALADMKNRWDKFADNYLQHIADDGDLECIINFVGLI